MATEEVHVRKFGITDMELSRGKTEQQAEFIALRAKGYSYTKIAQKLQVSKGTLTAWSQSFEREIAVLKALELEALQEQYYLLKEGRIELLGGLLEKLKAEALSRDLSEVSTEKLLELMLKVYQALKEEFVEVRPPAPAGLPEDKTGPKLNSQAIAQRLETTLERYQAGLIGQDQARQDILLYMALLKAREQAVLEAKLNRIEGVLEGRVAEWRSQKQTSRSY